MNPRFFLAAAALLLAALVAFFAVWERERSQPSAPGDGTAARLPAEKRYSVGPEPADPTAQTAPSPDSRPLLQAEQRVRDLEATLALAQERLREAERGLAASETEVEELEQMIDAIKARGEDPADYSDLAMERFQPAFFRFQDAQAAHDNALRLRREAESALAAARAELSRRRSAEAEER
jgi:hypothetical protein